MATITAGHGVGKGKNASRGHPFGSVTRPAPRYTADYSAPFGHATKLLAIDSDKRLVELVGVPGITPSKARDWRRGKVRAPAWAIDKLHAYATEKVRADNLALWILEQEKEKAGN